MKNRGAHQSDDSLKDLLPFLLSDRNDGLDSGVGLRAPFGAEPVGHFAMDDTRARRLF